MIVNKDTLDIEDLAEDQTKQRVFSNAESSVDQVSKFQVDKSKIRQKMSISSRFSKEDEMSWKTKRAEILEGATTDARTRDSVRTKIRRNEVVPRRFRRGATKADDPSSFSLVFVSINSHYLDTWTAITFVQNYRKNYASLRRRRKKNGGRVVSTACSIDPKRRRWWYKKAKDFRFSVVWKFSIQQSHVSEIHVFSWYLYYG